PGHRPAHSRIAGAYLMVVHTPGGKSAGFRADIRTPDVCRAPKLDFGFVASCLVAVLRSAHSGRDPLHTRTVLDGCCRKIAVSVTTRSWARQFPKFACGTPEDLLVLASIAPG